VQINSPYAPTTAAEAVAGAEDVDLDAQDEFAVRDLLLGITHRAAGAYDPARLFLEGALRNQSALEGKWVVSMAYFELAVLDMREVQAAQDELGDDEAGVKSLQSRWQAAVAQATQHLDSAAAHLGDTELSSRLESRIAMLRDELALKMNMIT